MIDDFLPMQEPYTPKQAVQAIDNGESVESVLARLDVDQCHFTKRVDDQGKEPVMRTGLSIIGEPTSGLLSLSVEKSREQQSQMNKSVLVLSPEMHQEDVRYSSQANGLIPLCPGRDAQERRSYNHFLIGVSSSSSVLLDNPLDPQITLLEDGSGIMLKNGQILREDDPVTIDPVSGRIWAEELPLLPPEEDAQNLLGAVAYFEVPEDITRISVHVSQQADFNAVFEVGQGWKNLNVGLRRTDVDCHDIFKATEKTALMSMCDGAVPLALRSWDSYPIKSMKTNYRLPDLHNLRDVLPDELLVALDKGEDHDLDKPLFNFRETLYHHQLSNLIRVSEDAVEKNEITIIIPSVNTVEEVVHFKKMVEEVTPPELQGQIKFGVMIETKEALDNIEAIAKQCDYFCVGTNGLTEALIPECPRDVLDHSAYMKKHGLEGISPYEVLVPEVYDPLSEALYKARCVNPNLFINMCGHQTGGHDIDSINTALDMGVDQLTVPPHLENMLRTQVAIAAHMAHYKLYVEPNFNYGMDLF